MYKLASCIYVLTVGLILGMLFRSHGMRALAVTMGAPIAKLDSGDFWTRFGFDVAWIAILTFIYALYVRYNGKYDMISDLVPNIFQAILNYIWLLWVVRNLQSWFAGAMSGLPLSLAGNNTDAPDWTLASTILASCFIYVGWAGYIRLLKPPAKGESWGYLEKARTSVNRTLNFVYGGTWGYLVGWHFAIWWVSVVFGKTLAFPESGTALGFNILAVLIMSVAMGILRAFIPTGDKADVWNSLLVIMIRDAMVVTLSICLALWITYPAIIGLSRAMTGEPPAFNSTNPLCPTKVDVYPSMYAGETLLFFLIAFLCGLAIWWFMPRGDMWIKNAESTSPYDKSLVQPYRTRYVIEWSVDAKWPFVYAVSYAIAYLLNGEGVNAMGQYVLCNADQRFGSRVAGTFIVLLLLSAIEVAYMRMYPGERLEEPAWEPLKERKESADSKQTDYDQMWRGEQRQVDPEYPEHPSEQGDQASEFQDYPIYNPPYNWNNARVPGRTKQYLSPFPTNVLKFRTKEEYDLHYKIGTHNVQFEKARGDLLAELIRQNYARKDAIRAMAEDGWYVDDLVA